MNKKDFWTIALSTIICLTSMGCSFTGNKDYSYDEIFVADDTLENIEVGYLDNEFDEPDVIIPRPYEFVVDYRYLNVASEEKDKIKLSKLIFDKNYSSRLFHNKKSNRFFKDLCLRYINLKHNSSLKLYDLLDKNIIDIDLNVKKIINSDDAIFLSKATITFNKDMGKIKKGDIIKQQYVLSFDGKLLAYVLNEFNNYTEEGSINDAITTLDILGLGSHYALEEDIPEIEKYLYFHKNELEKRNRV